MNLPESETENVVSKIKGRKEAEKAHKELQFYFRGQNAARGNVPQLAGEYFI